MARRAKKSSKVYVISIAVHLAIGLSIAFIPKDKLKEIIAISMGESQKQKPPPPKREDKPRAPPTRVAAARGASRGPASTLNAATTLAAPVFTDIGISMDGMGSEGVAVATAPKARALAPVLAPEPVKPKVLAAKTSDTCDEPIVKALPERVVQAEYPVEARSARIEGRLRVEIQLDERGQVLSAKVLNSLGHGLDEAALDAAKRTRFRPATRCGKPIATPFVLAMRFVLGT
jgi:protein TonB